MEHLEKQLTEILADPHVHEVFNAWVEQRLLNVLPVVLSESGSLDALVRSLCYRGRFNELTDMKDEIEALHEKGQNELNK